MAHNSWSRCLRDGCAGPSRRIADTARRSAHELPSRAGFTRDHVRRGAPLRTGLGQRQKAVLKLEHRQRTAPRRLTRAIAPVQPPRDHQMDGEPEVAVKPDRDALADTANLADRMAR